MTQENKTAELAIQEQKLAMIKASPEGAKFELTQRTAQMYSASSMVPKDYQGNIANCAIAINISERLRADVFAVMQSMHVIHGRPSWASTFLIAMVNASGRFSPLKFHLKGEGESMECYASATDLSTGESVDGPSVSMKMAKAEGWVSKAGSKWKTMPEVMIRYRAASFFAKLYAPDITLGMQTKEEAEDLGSKGGFDTAKPVDLDLGDNPLDPEDEAPVLETEEEPTEEKEGELEL